MEIEIHAPLMLCNIQHACMRMVYEEIVSFCSASPCFVYAKASAAPLGVRPGVKALRSSMDS